MRPGKVINSIVFRNLDLKHFFKTINDNNLETVTKRIKPTEYLLKTD